jgi:hypothetical protein
VRAIDELPPPCNDCILRPTLISNDGGKPNPFEIQFKAVQGEYNLIIDSDDKPGGLIELELNGIPVAPEKKPISGDITLPIRLGGINILKGRLLGRPGAHFILEIPQTFPPGSCPQQRDFLVYPTTPPELLASIVPLGNLNPPDHVLPTHHVYMSPLHSGEAGRLPVHSPYAGRVAALGRAADRGDYYLYLTVCQGLQLYFIHLTELSPRLSFLTAEPFGGFDLGPGTFKLTSVDVAPNELIGFSNNLYGPYDLGIVDRNRAPNAFANPSRYEIPPELIAAHPEIPLELIETVGAARLHQFCAIDYFNPSVRATLEPLFGSFDGTRRRTSSPVCGAHMQDLVGTAQGNWFVDDAGGLYPEQHRIALVHDNVDPSVPVFSLDETVASWSAGYWAYARTPTGFVNRDFSAVIPGAVYCFDGMTSGGTASRSVLVEVFGVGGEAANRLRVERTGAVSCGAGPWTFSAAASVYLR